MFAASYYYDSIITKPTSFLRLLVLSLTCFVIGFQYYFNDDYYLNYMMPAFQSQPQTSSSSLSSSGSTTATTTTPSSPPLPFEQQKHKQKSVSTIMENKKNLQQLKTTELPLLLEENENENGSDGSSSDESTATNDNSHQTSTTAQTATAAEVVIAFEEKKGNNNNKDDLLPQQQQQANDTTSIATTTTKQKTKYSLKQVITNPEIQGYHIPQDMIDWNLHGSLSSSSSSRNFTKTLCTASKSSYPSSTIRKMFLPYNNENKKKKEWKLVEVKKDNHINESTDFCENSLIRLLRGPKSYKADGSPPDDEKPSDRLKLLRRLEAHSEGEQLTTPIIKRARHWAGKPVLSKTITNSNNTLLIDAIPVTRIFNSTQHCQDFCDGEWLETTTQSKSKWIWKPSNAMGGKGIIMIDDLESCHNHCKSVGGSTLQAQVVSDTMYLDDGRKFDIRSHILIANVHPLIVFVGAERIRICAESSILNNTQVTPFPGLLPNSTWNPFQQVCNLHVGQKHPIKGVWTPEKNLGSLKDGIPNYTTRRRVVDKLDNYNRELLSLLAEKFQYDGKVGMFQMFATDFLVDRSEKLWFLEMNQQPGHTDTGIYYPNPWGDVLNIEWTILQTFQEFSKNPNVDWTTVLDQRLSELEIETLRRVI